MKKIPTIFERDWDGDRSRVLDKPTAAHAEIGLAVPTRKWDGAAALVRGGELFKRYNLRPGKRAPRDFDLVDTDAETGKQFGWVPVGDGPEDQWFRQAEMPKLDGTYELIGPKVNGNPEGYDEHCLMLHGAEVLPEMSTTFRGIRRFLAEHEIEGIVWWGWRNEEASYVPIAKIKRRDFGLEWPVRRDDEQHPPSPEPVEPA